MTRHSFIVFIMCELVSFSGIGMPVGTAAEISAPNSVASVVDGSGVPPSKRAGEPDVLVGSCHLQGPEQRFRLHRRAPRQHTRHKEHKEEGA